MNKTKKCTGPCGKTKPLADFPNGRGRLGKRSQCSDCKRKAGKRYRDSNAVEIKQRRQESKDKHYAAAKEYAKRNAAQIAAQKARRYKETKEAVIARVTAWQKRNKEAVAGYKKRCEEKHHSKYMEERRARSKNDDRDCYIRNLLVSIHKVKRENVSEELIEFTRQVLIFKRIKKQLKQTYKEIYK